MDYSKLSTEELLALKQGDYSKLSTDTLRALKQEAPAPAELSMMDKVKGAYNQYKESPVYKASPMGMLNTANDLVHKGADAAGQFVTEKMGGSGIPVVSNPNVAAGVGTAIQMAPDLGMAATGSGLARGAAKAGELGMAGRIVSGPARAEAGAAMGAAERAVGVKTDIIPTIKDVTANLGLKNASAKQYLNALMERLQSGEEMSPQALSQHHKMISSLMENEPSALAKKVFGAKSNLGAQGSTAAAKADAEIVRQLNQAAPGRGEGAANYAAAMKRQAAYKGAGAVGMAAIGGNHLTSVLKKVFGGQ